MTKFWEKNWRGASRASFFLEILSPSEPILRAKIENMISPDYVLCYIPWALETLDKNENFVIVEQGGGGPFDVSGGPFVVLEILEKNSEFGNFFSKILKIWKFSKFWIKISKVGSKFWRWEGYMYQKNMHTQSFT